MNLDFGNGNTGGVSGVSSLNLQKNMTLDLTKHSNLKHIRVGMGWQANANGMFDLDASALLLNSRGLINDNGDVIFYNQLDTGRGVRSEGDNRSGSYDNVGATDDETILVDLDRIPSNVNSVKFIVTIDKAIERRQNFGQVRQAYIRVVNDDTGEELCIYRLNEEFDMQICVEIAELKRAGSGWEFTALGKGTNETLENILMRHGVK